MEGSSSSPNKDKQDKKNKKRQKKRKRKKKKMEFTLVRLRLFGEFGGLRSEKCVCFHGTEFVINVLFHLRELQYDTRLGMESIRFNQFCNKKHKNKKKKKFP
jgi:hypothetical protein